jgi:CRP-like cAMP-binding protein
MSDNHNHSVTPPYMRRLLQEPPPILNGFHHDDLLDFLTIGIEEEYAKSEVMLDTTDYVNSGFLICEGELGIWEGNIELTTLSAPSFLGETFIFGDSHRMAKIVARQDSLILRFQRHDMLLFFKRRPGKLFNIFTRNIIHIQQSKMKEMNKMMFSLKKQLVKPE